MASVGSSNLVTRNQVISGFRKLLKLRKVVFAGDEHALKSSANALKSEFLKNKNEEDPIKLAEMIKGIDEVEEMLRFNIVQAKENDEGNYAVNFTDDHKASMRNDDQELNVITESGVAETKEGCCGGDGCDDTSSK
mmetsp:Transcript_35148/g.45131  ORF Transcript_35148/g.45131 Transcript_35148/m.45131 type:complete len:136 (+) Transcript_35148:82-489(+)